MTVVAFDGQTLAADRHAVLRGVPHAVRKVHKLTAPNGRRALLGFSGLLTYGQQYMAWMLGHAPEPPKPDTDTMILLVDERRRIWFRAPNVGVWTALPVRQFAIGCGGDYAIGAMAKGADAIESVKIASRWDNDCGLGVDYVRF